MQYDRRLVRHVRVPARVSNKRVSLDSANANLRVIASLELNHGGTQLLRSLRSGSASSGVADVRGVRGVKIKRAVPGSFSAAEAGSRQPQTTPATPTDRIRNAKVVFAAMNLFRAIRAHGIT